MALKINLHPAMGELAREEPPSSSSASTDSASAAVSFSPLLPAHYEELKQRMELILENNFVPRSFRTAVVQPFFTLLDENDQSWFSGQLEKGEIQDIVAAILQNFDDPVEGKIPRGRTEALREALSDLHQNFIGRSVSDICSTLHQWSEEEVVRFSRPNPELGIDASIVHVPSLYARRGILAWGCLGHEAAGLAIFASYPKALKELKHQFQLTLKKEKLSHLGPYWTRWFDEGAADVLAVLNRGPAAALSLIGFLRAESPESSFQLSRIQYVQDDHSIDLVRGFLVAYAVQTMNAEGKLKKYAGKVMEEVEKDATDISHLRWDVISLGPSNELSKLLKEFCQTTEQNLHLNSDSLSQARQWVESPRWREEFFTFLVSKNLPQTRHQASDAPLLDRQHGIFQETSLADFKRSAELFAQTVINSKLEALGHQSFSSKRSWGEKDEKIYDFFRALLKLPSELDPIATYKEGFFPTHVIAAAVMESITEVNEQKISRNKLHRIFERMIEILQTMHKTNSLWQLSEEASTESTED